MTYPCPFCGAVASDTTGCPSCGRAPDPLALEVVRLDGVIADLTTRLNAARLTAQRLDGELKQAWVRRAAAAADVRAAVAPTRTVPVTIPAPGPVPPRADASTKWIQNALFLLGGLLLAVAAIVFTAVAWAQFGVGGRAALLAVFTGAALGVPPLAARRGLTGTAETFAAIGLLLILLDGYAAWYVNLLGVTRWSPWSYAALVLTVTAGVALAFPRLTGPRFVALLAAQPVLPLLAVPAVLGATGHAFVYAGVLALDLTVLALTRDPVRVVGGALAAVGLLPVGGFALAGLLEADSLGRAGTAGAALLLTAALPLVALHFPGRRLPESPAAPDSSASPPPSAVPLPRAVPVVAPVAGPDAAAVLRVVRALFAALMVIEAAAVAVRTATLIAPAHILVAGSLAVLGVAVLAATVRSIWLDRVVGRGVRFGTGVALVPFSAAAFAAAVSDAALTLQTARPPLHAALTATVPATDPRLLPTLAAVAAAIAVTVPSAWRRLALLLAAAAAVVAVPAALHLPWWSAPLLDLAGTAAALYLASRAPAPRTITYGCELTLAVLLAAHGVGTATGTPAVLAATLTALAVLAAAVAAVTHRGPHRLDLAGPGILTSLVLVPAIAWSTTAALTTSPYWQSRIPLAAALLPPAVYLRRGERLADLRPFALAAALIPIAIAPAWAPAAGDSAAIYAGVSLLALAALPAHRAVRAAAAIPAAAFVIVTAVPFSRLVLVDPFADDGKRIPAVAASVPVAFLLVAVAGGLWTVLRECRIGVGDSAPPSTGVGEVRGPRHPAVDQRRVLDGLLGVTAPLSALTVALGLAAARFPWPGLPGAELALGLAGLLAVALRAPATRPDRAASGAASTYPLVTRAFLTAISALLTYAALAALLPTRPAAITAVSALLVTGATAGTTGRSLPSRIIGWLTAVAAALGITHLVGQHDNDAFPVLAVAGATLALSWLLHRHHRLHESRSVEAAAHATALLALLLTGNAPAVCFLWGAAMAVRALRRDHRDAYLIAAALAELAGWSWLMLRHHVGLVEAYSIPASAVALLAGLRSRRRVGGALSSWAAYGPALAAGLLPSLASIAGTDGQYARRLLLGLAALTILLTGARARLQAPVVVGGGALALVALHELAQVWDLVPRWIPLAVAGLLLVVLAATLERRRRDLDRLRGALTRMT